MEFALLGHHAGPNVKIKPARRTKASSIKQSRAAQAIKQARFLALLPYYKSS